MGCGCGKKKAATPLKQVTPVKQVQKNKPITPSKRIIKRTAKYLTWQSIFLF